MPVPKAVAKKIAVVTHTAARKLSEVSLYRDKPVTFGILGPYMSAAEAQERIKYSTGAVDAAIRMVESIPETYCLGWLATPLPRTNLLHTTSVCSTVNLPRYCQKPVAEYRGCMQQNIPM